MQEFVDKQKLESYDKELDIYRECIAEIIDKHMDKAQKRYEHHWPLTYDRLLNMNKLLLALLVQLDENTGLNSHPFLLIQNNNEQALVTELCLSFNEILKDADICLSQNQLIEKLKQIIGLSQKLFPAAEFTKLKKLCKETRGEEVAPQVSKPVFEEQKKLPVQQVQKIQSVPQQLIEGKPKTKKRDPIEEINSEIDVIFKENIMKQKDAKNIETSYKKVWVICKEALAPKYHSFDLVKYGSAINGLSIIRQQEDSDLDLVLVVQAVLQENLNQQKNEEDIILRNLAKTLRSYSDIYESVEEINTTFGLIIQFRDKFTNTNIDLQVNKVVDVYNSYLIQQYARQDLRFHELAIILKIWNKYHFKDRMKRLNSYSLTLMLIAYLQYMKVLPNLQEKAADNPKMIRYHKYFYIQRQFNQGVYLEQNLYFETDLSKYTHLNQNLSNMSPAELLIGFFEFYAESSNTKDIVIQISINNSPFLKKNTYIKTLNQRYEGVLNGDNILSDFVDNMRNEWAFTIVDPFDFTYNPAKQIKTRSPDHTKYLAQFSKVAKALKNGVSLRHLITKNY